MKETAFVAFEASCPFLSREQIARKRMLYWVLKALLHVLAVIGFGVAAIWLFAAIQPWLSESGPVGFVTAMVSLFFAKNCQISASELAYVDDSAAALDIKTMCQENAQLDTYRLRVIAAGRELTNGEHTRMRTWLAEEKTRIEHTKSLSEIYQPTALHNE